MPNTKYAPGLWIGMNAFGCASLFFICLCCCLTTRGDEVEDRFQEDVKSFVTKYCQECHVRPEPEAKFDIEPFSTTKGIVTNWNAWQMAVDRIVHAEMPPKDSALQPSDMERSRLSEWSKKLRRQQALLKRGDPGVVAMRRLSNAEWNNTIRDLTGVDIEPAKDFPVDPANSAGFDNSAESLTISPALVGKYIAAARLVADHMLLTPEGVRFAPFPVVTDTDRDRYCVQRIVDFYQRQPTNLTSYLIAATDIARELKDLKGDDATTRLVVEHADKHKLSGRYLATVFSALTDEKVSYGPLRELQQRWHRLVEADGDSSVIGEECEQLMQYVVGQREKLRPDFQNLNPPGGINGGSQPLVLWKNRQQASHRMHCREDGFSADPESSVFSLELRQEFDGLSDQEKGKVRQDYQTFCRIFPDTFYLSERGRAHIDSKDAAREGKGRLLSAGFHSMMGFFRDDQPLCELVLSEQERAELDQLWYELDFITLAPFRQYSGHLWFERAEASFINDERFNFVRAEDRSAASSEMIQKFAAAYLGKLKERNADGSVSEAVEYYFSDMDRQLRKLERDLQETEAKQLGDLIRRLDTIFRMAVGDDIKAKWTAFYEASRSLPTATHRSAMEDTLVAMLLSPQHLYRWDLATYDAKPVELNDVELASRWSYFLWASSPDERLRGLSGRVLASNPDSIREEFARMVQDDRFEGMSKEFVGNWLDFRRFENHNGVDRHRFPEFNDELRKAMFQEPVQYFMDVVRRNGKVSDLIDSDQVVVNRLLAEFYGVEELYNPAAEEWQRIRCEEKIGRGGFLSMGVFLTQNSPGLRTSPVKRGYWVVRKLLGEQIPAPPPNVPELPNSESDLGAMTLREALEKHREHPSCAGCHARFDSYGLLLEGFDPIGRPRTVDMGGRAISTAASLPDGTEENGIAGLRKYLSSQRGDDFRRHFCQSLVAYALGRSLVIADDLLVDEMLTELERNDDRIQTAFVVLLSSPQFQWKRGQESLHSEDSDAAK